MSGELVISLDFELLWGVRDHATRDSYGANVLRGREAIPRILDLFEHYGIAATWATVGLLMAESRDELLASLPPEELRPKAGALRVIHPLHVRVIKRAMTQAARTNASYHLWWHPHNFGLKTGENLAVLADILAHFQGLKHKYSMASCTITPDLLAPAHRSTRR